MMEDGKVGSGRGGCGSLSVAVRVKKANTMIPARVKPWMTSATTRLMVQRYTDSAHPNKSTADRSITGGLSMTM